ncbi:hypothetical protein BMF94_5010 [Rhodotorula taiwanensis]|uniref:Uncharacterized protein n=1 Tax=Rhodotorula taiwanensis TaxID=741276 RepID=A0A2S5B5L0_9BASI|nr:hypothetical protein BMF94_5010 [Rhodotorula taiwanensis]
MPAQVETLPASSGAPPLLVLGPAAAFSFGFTSGVVSASKLASKQFLAENAHRLPTTVQGWYFYQKTKNYRVAWSGIKGGLRTGARLGLWTGAFLGCEELVDRACRFAVDRSGVDDPDRVKSKWISGTVAGAGLATAAGWYYRLHRASAPRRLAIGLAMGALAGATIDLRDWLRGKLPARSTEQAAT